MSINNSMETTTDELIPPRSPHISWSDSFTRSHIAIEALSTILPFIPPTLSSSDTPAFTLLHDPEIAAQISRLLRQPTSGVGHDDLCRWLYDTFQSSEPDLQLIVLRYLPTLAGIYLSRVALHKPLAGFEAVLLALHAHETAARNGQAVTVNIPDLSRSSIYHETKQTLNNNAATDLNLTVISPGIEPQGTVKSTKRATIVKVAFELYYKKISQMPVDSKLDFCEFCGVWAGGKEKGGKARVHLPWELLQVVLRILGHCLMGPRTHQKLRAAATEACRSLYTRSLHDMNTKAILASGSLLKLANMDLDDGVDHTEISMSNVINL